MDKNIVDRLKAEFGPVEYFPGPFKTLPGGWFLLKLSPLPPLDERKMVATDICRNGLIHVNDGKVYHSPNCEKEKHRLTSKYHHVRNILKELDEKTFHLAVYPGQPNVLNAQPIVIAIEPEISYIKYPDHPHLNNCRRKLVEGFNFFIPDSFCYTDNPNELGGSTYDRLKNTFNYISVWLYRHQIWLATRKINKTGTWIGPAKDALSPKYYPSFLNPFGNCRCGLDKKYVNCHFEHDLKEMSKQYSNPTKKFKQLKYKYLFPGNWEKNIFRPYKSSITLLKNILL